MLLGFNSKPWYSRKQAVWAVGIALCYEGLLEREVRGSPAQHLPMGCKGQVTWMSHSAEYCAWPVWALGDGLRAPPCSVLLAGPSASCSERPEAQPQHGSHTSLLTQCHRAQEQQQHLANTSDQWPVHGCGQASLVCASAAACNPNFDWKHLLLLLEEGWFPISYPF